MLPEEKLLYDHALICGFELYRIANGFMVLFDIEDPRHVLVKVIYGMLIVVIVSRLSQ